MKKAAYLIAGIVFGSSVEAVGFTGNVDYLFWHSSQSGMNYAVQTNSLDTFEHQNPLFQRNDWASGVRLGAGYGINCNWDVNFSWTRFHNSVFGEARSGFIVANQLLSLQLGSPIVGGNAALAAIGRELGPAKSRWDLNFDRFDLNFGGNLYKNRVFTFHPTVGISGIIVNQSQHISYENFIDTGSSLRADATVKQVNNYWGIGPSAGFDSTVCLGYGLNIVGQFNCSAFYGRLPSKYSVFVKEDNTLIPSILTLNRNSLIPSVQLFLGFEWETKIANCYSIGATVGYEAQYYWGLWRVQNSGIQTLYITDAGYNSLEFNGITARVSFGF